METRHRISGLNVVVSVSEMAWREDHCRETNEAQYERIAGAVMKCDPSVDFTGYWQRHIRAAA